MSNLYQYLATSLPHGLCLQLDTEPKKSIGNLESIDKSGSVDSFFEGADGSEMYELFELDKVKPICHSLSDLSKPITHNGKRFVPIDVLTQKYISIGQEFPPLIEGEFKNMEYQVAEKLFEWHFAINLNEDEYVDVNSLDINPYK